jgi:hypothetical protein
MKAPIIIAEIGCNHKGDMNIAKEQAECVIESINNFVRMKYNEALSLCQDKQSLVGTTGDNGNVIGAVVVVPSNANDANEYWRRYIYSDYNAVYAIAPYIGSDMRVMTVDLYHLKANGVLFYDDITEE